MCPSAVLLARSTARLAMAGACLACLLLCAARLTAEDPDSAPRVAALILQLGSPRYAERETASQALAELGAGARPFLEQAARDQNLEVRLAAQALVRQLALQELWDPSRVRGLVDGARASEILQELSAQTGNRLLVGDQFGSFHDAPTHVAREQATFWEVLDELCRQTNNQVRPHYDSSRPGLVVVSGEAGQYPTTYAGPVRAQVTGARRQFVEELDYRQLHSEQTHAFQLNLQLLWEDRFRLVAYRAQPELVEALTDTNASLVAAQSGNNGWNVASAGSRQMAVSLRLTPPPTAARELDLLRLRWGLIAVGDLATLELAELGPSEPRMQDDLELTVESFQMHGQRCEMTLLVVRDLVVPEPQEVLFQENQYELFDAQDRPFRLQGQTNSLSDQGARMRLSWTAPAADSTPTRFRCTYPRLRSQHDLEIVFRHVPLPVSRPD